MPVHISLVLGGGGSDIATWVSAGSAVVQAVGAVGAIIFSVKIARDAAVREKKADQANVRRIEAANAAAVEQRQIDEQIREEKEKAAFNAPLIKAAELGDGALADLRITFEKYRRDVVEGNLPYFSADPRPLVLLARAQLPYLVTEANSGSASAAIAHLETILQFPAASQVYQPPEWVTEYERVIPKVELAIAKVRHQLR